jgi:hypothetical protein
MKLPNSPIEFLKKTGWQTPCKYADFETAYRFFLQNVPLEDLTTEVPPGFYALKYEGKFIQLTQWLQAIDFNDRVSTILLNGSNLLWSYEAIEQMSPGKWFTFIRTPREKLAIDDSKVDERIYVVRSSVLGLESTVSDAYVDWGANTGLNAKYRHAGAGQVFIWEARRYLVRFDPKSAKPR